MTRRVFYKRAIFDGLKESKPKKAPQNVSKNVIENPIARENINAIHLQSSEAMTQLPDNSVHLMVTSPPYNAGKEYDEDLTAEQYLELLNNIWKETYFMRATA